MDLASRLKKSRREAMQAEILRSKLQDMAEDSREFLDTAQRLLTLEPYDRSLRLQLAWGCFNRSRYECARREFARLAKETPENPEVFQWLGWSLFKQGEYALAADAFEKALGVQPSQKRAQDLLLALDRADEPDKLSLILRAWRTSENPELSSAAAAQYRAWKLPVLADQAHPGLGPCYSGCSKPWLETGFLFSHREAEEGFSGLDQARFPVSLHMPQEFGRVWSVSLTPLHLDAGSTGRFPFAGSYYKYLETGQSDNALEDELRGLEPRVGLLVEGRPTFAFELGLTPLGGPVDSMPTFSLEAFQRDIWSIRLHQCPVQDSLLSYVGQQDPYSDRHWGRVLKTGLEGSRTFSLTDRVWLAMEMGGHFYWGKNVVENTSLSGTISFGQTRTVIQGDLHAGLFATARHFERNSDFFTFGHGGYFSPDFFGMGGPFVRWTSKMCQSTWVDVQLGAGYFGYSTEEADFYHESDQAAADLVRESARINRTGRYDAESDEGLGVNAAVQAWHRLGDHLAVGAFGRLNTTSKYEEWQAGIVFRMTLSSRKRLCPSLDLLGKTLQCR
jgi:tetratricopeptide (TPR) repeat protein